MPNIEEIIRKAMEDGAFENLSGRGQPLAMDTNPNADPEWELAFHILKENGFAPAFIEERQEIEASIAKFRAKLTEAVADSATWPSTQNEFEAQLTEINRRIRNYNLSVPHEKLSRSGLDLGKEIAKINTPGT